MQSFIIIHKPNMDIMSSDACFNVKLQFHHKIFLEVNYTFDTMFDTSKPITISFVVQRTLYNFIIWFFMIRENSGGC